MHFTWVSPLKNHRIKTGILWINIRYTDLLAYWGQCLRLNKYSTSFTKQWLCDCSCLCWKCAAPTDFSVWCSFLRPSSTSSTSSIPHLPVKSSLGSSNSSSSSSVRKNNIPTSSNQGSNSMLEKFKLFNPKDKNQEKTKGKFYQYLIC